MSSPSVRVRFRFRPSAVGLVALLGVAGLGAQQTPPQLPVTATSAASQRIVLEAGTSTVLNTDFDVTRVHVTDSEIADALVVEPRELVLLGKSPGRVSLIVWGEGRRVHYEIAIDPGVAQLEQQLKVLFPGEDIRVSRTEGAVILSGRVSTNETMLRVGEIATKSVPDLQVISMLQLPGASLSQQVMLQVRFAEVNRRAVEELGLSLFTTRSGFTARSTTQQFPAPDFDDIAGTTGGLVFADFLNIFFFQRNEGIGGVLKALQQNGWFESLAEPNLIAYNGQEASFLAGGEIPIPVIGGNTGVPSVDWKEYGVRLRFRPTIAGDTIRLHVRPEVSSLDFANGVTISGFRIPALQTRYAETEIELRDGQSFAIAGLLDTIGQEDKAAIPILSRIPIIGSIFRSRARREEQTELMVLITPRLVRPLNPDQVPPLPAIIRAPGGRGGGGADLGSHLLGGGGLVDAPRPVSGRSGGGGTR